MRFDPDASSSRPEPRRIERGSNDPCSADAPSISTVPLKLGGESGLESIDPEGLLQACRRSLDAPPPCPSTPREPHEGRDPILRSMKLSASGDRSGRRTAASFSRHRNRVRAVERRSFRGFGRRSTRVLEGRVETVPGLPRDPPTAGDVTSTECAPRRTGSSSSFGSALRRPDALTRRTHPKPQSQAMNPSSPATTAKSTMVVASGA